MSRFTQKNIKMIATVRYGNPIGRSQTYCTEIIGEVGGLGFLVTPVESGYVLRSSFAIARDGGCRRHDDGGLDTAPSSNICITAYFVVS